MKELGNLPYSFAYKLRRPLACLAPLPGVSLARYWLAFIFYSRIMNQRDELRVTVECSDVGREREGKMLKVGLIDGGLMPK